MWRSALVGCRVSWVLGAVSVLRVLLPRCLFLGLSDLVRSCFLFLALPTRVSVLIYASHTYASAMLCRGSDMLLMLAAIVALWLLLKWRGRWITACIISFEGGSCTKVEQAGMRSVRLGRGTPCVLVDLSIMGHDRARQASNRTLG